MRSILLFLILILPLSVSAQAFFGGTGFSSKNTDSVRWTLADWLQQKKDFKLQDQWLALNTQANLYEFNISGGRSSYDSKVNGVTTKETLSNLSATFWVSIFGLEYRRATSSEDFVTQSGQFNVRLLGQSPYSTNLTANYGIRKTDYENPSNELTNNFAGADMRLYLVKNFGLTAGYEKSFEGEDKGNTAYEGERIDYGAFIEILFFRISGSFYSDTTNVTPSGGAKSEQVREGLQTSVQFYL